MTLNGKGGCKTITGLNFESIINSYKLKDYIIKDSPDKIGKCIYTNDNILFLRVLKKYGFYKFLETYGIKWTNIISKRLLPDGVFVNVSKKIIYIIEIKFQQTGGSVDEKLQTCGFKKRQYEKLVKSIGFKIEFIYVLNDWFKKQEYRDTLEYINSVNCQYVFNSLPFKFMGLKNVNRNKKCR